MADTLRGLALGLKGVLDFATLERMPASFVTEHLGRRHADMLAPIPEQLLGTQPRHPYLLMELQRLDPSTLPYSSVLSMIARLEQARSPEQLEALVATLVDWVESADAEELLDSFREWISQVLVQRHGPAGRALELKIRNDEEARMTTLIERARQWGEELNQHWLEKGIEEGLERGRVEGERALVYRLVARRFGPGAAEQLVPVLDAITDPELIAAVADAVVECRTDAEFIGRAKEVVGR